MEERKKNLCAMIPESLHKKVREEQEEWGIKLNEYMERIPDDPDRSVLRLPLLP